MPCFLEETFEDIKGEIRSRKLYNGTKKKPQKNDKRTINAVQNTTEKTEQHEFC
jgi:hypothetical protein